MFNIAQGNAPVIRAGIVGASGYSGLETLRLLFRRTDVCVERATAASSAGQRLDTLAPAFAGRTELVLEEFTPARFEGLDVVFVALPSGEGMKVVPSLRAQGLRVIDLGGDFRLQSTDAYLKYYKQQHVAPELLPAAVYGLPELNREAIARANLVSNPGCYATSAILALLPVLVNNIIESKGIAVSSSSGTSGAGRKGTVDMSFSEVNENVKAYRVGVHQHTPEIESVLTAASKKDVTVSFVPHLLPITRGIYTTIHATLMERIATERVYEHYRDYYAGAPFVRIRSDVPQIAAVTRTNYCDIGVYVDERTQTLILMSVLDNLIKGAAGQAVQNMNIMFGIPEDFGLQA